MSISKFASTTRAIALYFSNSIADLIRSQNNLLVNSFGIVDKLIETGKVPNDKEMQELKKKLKGASLPKESFELDRIQ